MSEFSISDIVDLFRSKDNFVLISHTNPDGDTVGCTYAVYLILKKLGKRVRCLCDKQIPARLAFICPEGIYDSRTDIAEDEYVITLDVASPNMLGRSLEAYADRVDLRIDHHGKSTPFAKINYVEPSASACAEIIFEIGAALNVIDPAIASAIFSALSSDTGCFRYSNTTARTHMTAAYLISLGANASEINEALFDTVTYSELAIYPIFLNNCERLYNGRVNIVALTNDEKAKYGITDADLDELSSLSRKTAGTNLGVVIKQVDDNETEFKVSMRSRKPVDCSVICASIGGGGHTRASGATITANSIDSAKAIVLSAIRKFLEFDEQ